MVSSLNFKIVSSYIYLNLNDILCSQFLSKIFHVSTIGKSINKYCSNLLFRFLGYLSHSGALLLQIGVRHRASFIVGPSLTSLHLKLLGSPLTHLQGKETRICNFMTPTLWGLNFGVKTVKFMQIFEIFFILLGMLNIQTN